MRRNIGGPPAIQKPPVVETEFLSGCSRVAQEERDYGQRVIKGVTVERDRIQPEIIVVPPDLHSPGP